MGPDWPVFPCPRASLCVIEGSAALLAAYRPSSYRLRHRPRCATRGSSLRVRRWIPSSPRTPAAARSLEVSASTPWPRCPRTHHRPRFYRATGVAALSDRAAAGAMMEPDSLSAREARRVSEESTSLAALVLWRCGGARCVRSGPAYRDGRRRRNRGGGKICG
ncbi:hypothetical protein B0H13DRAFT_2017390 [Mycena leptocephala]|nr:hypothetical protein B0H13DRAFT_2017390 [Mycena leptocephala]